MPQEREERARVAELKSYGVLDTDNEPEFDALVREAAELAGVPIALISLIDETRQWFKARVGLEAKETPRAISFCTHAIQGPDVMEVGNAADDERFRTNPLVTGNPDIRYYAGAPLKTSTGRRLGTLCVIDNRAHAPMSDDVRRKLEALADRTVLLFEARRERTRQAV